MPAVWERLLWLRDIIGDVWLMGLSGALSVIFGVLALAQPAAGALAIVYLFGLYATLVRIAQIAFGVRLHRLEGAVERRVQRAPSGSH